MMMSSSHLLRFLILSVRSPLPVVSEAGKFLTTEPTAAFSKGDWLYRKTTRMG